MNARERKKLREADVKDDPWKTDWFKEIKKLLWPSSENKTPSPLPDSTQSATIFPPTLNGNNQKLIQGFRSHIRKMVKEDRDKRNPLKHLPIHRIGKSSSTKRRFYAESGEKRNSLPVNPREFGSFLRRRDLFADKHRNKRQTSSPNNQLDQFPNIQNLRRVETFFTQSEFIRGCRLEEESPPLSIVLDLQRLQQNNQRYLQRFTKSIKYDFKQGNFVDGIVDGLNEIFNPNKFGKLSIISPKILSIMPDSESESGILSPNILNFHHNGIFSMPELFKFASSDDREMLHWLEWLMKISGTGEHLDKLLTRVKDEIEQIEEAYPKIMKVRRFERLWSRVSNKKDRRQADDLKKHGYTFINRMQARRIYGNDKRNDRLFECCCNLNFSVRLCSNVSESTRRSPGEMDPTNFTIGQEASRV